MSNYRDLIGQREDEIRRQIDKIEVGELVSLDVFMCEKE